MKPVANSYSAKLTFPEAPAWGEKVVAFVPTIPNAVWLAMIFLAALLLAGSTLARSRNQFIAARNAQATAQTQLNAGQSANDELKTQTRELRANPRVAAQAAQAQSHYVKANEIVIAKPR